MLKIVVLSDLHLRPKGVLSHGLDTHDRLVQGIGWLNRMHADADLCAEKLHALHQRLEQAEGFRSLDTIRRDGGLGTDYYSLARFDSVEALEKWRASKERQELLGGIEELAITDISREQAAGSNIWFRPIGTMPSTPKAPSIFATFAVCTR